MSVLDKINLEEINDRLRDIALKLEQLDIDKQMIEDEIKALTKEQILLENIRNYLQNHRR